MPAETIHACECGPCMRGESHPERERHYHINLFLSRLHEDQRRWYLALEWGSINWPQIEGEVRVCGSASSRHRRQGTSKGPQLQRLILRSRANALVSVRRVTELNAGRKTAGVDGKVVVSAPAKAALADRVRHRAHPVTAQPVKRVYVPKANGQQRPRFGPKVYGFRPGRGCHDAIEAIFQVARGPNPSRRWVLDADLAAALEP